MRRPLAIDLFCGLSGWGEGLRAEGFSVIGFDIENMFAAIGEPMPAEDFQLVIQDVLTLHGSQFRDADLIVASPPCQEYSYMAMPWTRAKAKAAAIRADATGAELERLNALFSACFRIQREACEAAGRHIPMVVENVRGAIPWVGRSRWNFGSYHLWGDVPALMPPTVRATKVPGFRFDGSGGSFQTASVAETGYKSRGLNWSDPTLRGQDFTRIAGRQLAAADAGRKQPGLSGVRDNGKGDRWFQDGAAPSGSKSLNRKAASARIAKIPLTLSRWIAAHYLPRERAAA